MCFDTLETCVIKNLSVFVKVKMLEPLLGILGSCRVVLASKSPRRLVKNSNKQNITNHYMMIISI